MEADAWMSGSFSGPFGRSWTPIDPRGIRNYRHAAGLPDQNKGRFLVIAELLDPTGVEVRRALPYGKWLGGLVEYVFPPDVDVSRRVRIIRVLGLNPPF
ncbi:MAG: hypothetical protein QXI60_05165 [Thermofilaceae archaeon]